MTSEARSDTTRISAENKQSAIARIWSLMGEERGKVVQAMIFRLIQSVFLGLAYATVLWVIIRIAEGCEINASTVWQVAALMLLSLAGQMLFSFLSVRLAWSASFQITRDLRLALLDHLQSLPMGFHLTRQRGDLNNVLTSDPTMLESFLSEALPRLIQSVVLPLSVFTFMLFLDWRLALIMAFPILLGFPVMAVSSRSLAWALSARTNRLKPPRGLLNTCSGLKSYARLVALTKATNALKKHSVTFAIFHSKWYRAW